MGSWKLFTPEHVVSLNDVIKWKTNHQGWRYTKHREMWRRLFGQWHLAEMIPYATGRRRLHVVRLYSHPQRAFDDDNLHGGTKAIVDAMKPRKHTIGGRVFSVGGLIIDDNAKHLERVVEQRRGPVSGTEITLEDLP